jgi:hypothetical protein
MFINRANLREALKVARVAVVVVTRYSKVFFGLGLLLLSHLCHAAILPEDRADAMYHSYDGGGIEITGPSIIVRKQIGDSFSVAGTHYVDTITSASIDVIATASPYTEERTENSISLDYLRDKVTMSMAYTNSEENDFHARSLHLGVSQEIFGGMTTVSLGYSRGWDDVGTRGSTETFPTDRHNYRLGLSQVITKDLLMEIGLETITDEGESLNNPYRQVRFLTSPTTFDYQNEIYPNTRTSTAVALRAKYYLPYRAAIHGEYRWFNDTWGITAHNVELGYTHPFKDKWIFDIKLRGYQQNAADFYSDLFPFGGVGNEPQNFLARDKEMSSYSSISVGAGVSYEFGKGAWGYIDKGSINFSINHIQIDYDDFRDVLAGGTPGTEPLYTLEADVVQVFLSLWY